MRLARRLLTLPFRLRTSRTVIRRDKPTAFRPSVEALEPREVPAGAPAFAVGAGPGGRPEVRVLDSDGVVVRSFLAYDQGFQGGVRTAVADLTGDGTPDVITAPGKGGGPNVKVFDGATGDLVGSFFAYAPSFRGGVNVAAGDIGNGRVGIVTGADEGGGPHVSVFDAGGQPVRSFFAYDTKFTGGVNVAVGGYSTGGDVPQEKWSRS